VEANGELCGRCKVRPAGETVLKFTRPRKRSRDINIELRLCEACGYYVDYQLRLRTLPLKKRPR
jgi:hypothetical protein